MKKIRDKLNEKKNKTALIINNGKKITYKYLVRLVENFTTYISENSLIILKASNTLESIVVYLGAIFSNSTVILIGENDYMGNYIDAYNPKYIIIPKFVKETFLNYKKTKEFYNYIILENKIFSFEFVNDIAVLLSTSGSTGNPKCVKISYENLLSNTESIINSLKIKENDITITTLPMNYSYGLSIINTHLYCGATIVLCNYSVIQKKFWDSFLKYKVNNFGGVPFTYEIMLKLKSLNRDRLKNIRYLTQAGGKLNKRDLKQMINLAEENGFDFIVMYGQTEATARMSYLPWEYASKKINSIGIPIIEGQFKIYDEKNTEIFVPYQKGELIYIGKNVTLGYAYGWRNLVNKRDEWGGILYTGDMAYFDEDGFYYLVGRKKRIAKICGQRISLYDIEKILDDLGIRGICAEKNNNLYILIKEKNCNENTIHIELKKKINISKEFVKVFFVDDFPRNDYGKIIYDISKWNLGVK